MSEERLQKYLARAGVASRRASEKLIVSGRVKVNGLVVTELGSRVEPEKDRIEVDGRVVEPERLRYILLNKPPGVVSTADDPQGRTTVVNLVQAVRERLYPVGRLDYESEGLLLLTNDGELTERLLHPRYHLPRTYHVRLDRTPAPAEVERLRQGIDLDDGPTQPCRIEMLPDPQWGAGGYWCEMELFEGRNRQIRRMWHTLDYQVLRLIRVAMGPLGLGRLPSGRWRRLSRDELAALRREVFRSRAEVARKEGHLSPSGE